ncbi:ABC transporter ATP-binding protein [Paenibacillus sp. 1P07SE]|uniref:ABC transporter ATP-binding protein n=1 Tax=Paenibacillus sp. 1P07SE TaxID=3132209 RepID=UPI0039A4A5F0
MLLEMKGITKAYGGVIANKQVDFSLRKGEVHALVGENGAGKTTLMRILYGMESPTDGMISLNGAPMFFSSPADAIANGIGMVHQHFMLYPSFTIAENIVIGREPRRFGFIDRMESESAVAGLSLQYGMPVDPRRVIADCPLGVQQRVEILKVLHQGAEIIILDEPTGVLTPLEVKELLDSVRRLARSGKSFIIITHKLQEVMDVADRITVLRDGEVTGAVEASDTNVDELSRMMVGRELINLQRQQQAPGQPVLELGSITLVGNGTKPVLDDVSLTVHAGEIVGIAGISGNGQSELLQVVSGLAQPDAGVLKLLGEDIAGASVRKIRERGLAHIPEDRYQWGVSKEATVAENGLMGHTDKYQQYGVVRRGKVREMVRSWVERFSIKTGSLDTKAQHLSGGNLQKLIVARELEHRSPFLIAAEPTRGVDVGAMEVIHGELLKRRDEGGAILLVSSELTEILKLADRILVMYEGRIAGEVRAEDASEEQISLWMAGGKKDE